MCRKCRFHRILSTIPALFAQARSTFESQHFAFQRKGPFISAFSMGKGDLPIPHFSKQTWVCAFFITSVKSFYRDEKVVRSRVHVCFTTVKTRAIESAHFVVQFFFVWKWDIRSEKLGSSFSATDVKCSLWGTQSATIDFRGYNVDYPRWNGLFSFISTSCCSSCVH